MADRPVLIGRRTRRRGAIDRALSFAHARAARLSASPPIALDLGPPRAGPLRVEDEPGVPAYRSVARRLPWLDAAAPGSAPAIERAGVLVVHCEGSQMGGDYELLERTRREQPSAILIASDVFVDPSQLERARRAGADGVAPVMVALRREHPDDPLRELAGAARALGLELVPECATHADLVAARAEGAGRALVSLRDRDHHRPALDDAAKLTEDRAGLVLIGIFASSLPEELQERARALGLDALDR